MSRGTAGTVSRSRRGFTLMEVVIAIALFAWVAVQILVTVRQGTRTVIEADENFVAVQLAESKLAELEEKYSRAVNRDGVEASMAEEEGTFEGDYVSYTWHASFQQTTLEFTSELLGGVLQDFGIDEEVAKAQMEQNALLITNLNKNIKAHFGELAVTIKWKSPFGEKSMRVVTHITPDDPKIEISTQADGS